VDLGVLTLEIVQFQSENIHLSLLSTAAEASKFTSTSTGCPPVPNNSKMSYDITSKTLQLPSSAVNMTLPAFAAERLLQIDISLRALGGRSAANLRSLDGTDRRKDPRPFHRLCSAYYTIHFRSGLNLSPLCQVPLQRLRDSAHFIFRRDHSLKL